MHTTVGEVPDQYIVHDIGEDAFNELSQSTNTVDKSYYNEFCHFIIENPLRKDH